MIIEPYDYAVVTAHQFPAKEIVVFFVNLNDTSASTYALSVTSTLILRPNSKTLR